MTDFFGLSISLVLGGLYTSLMFFVPLWGPQLVFRKLTPAPPPSAKPGPLRFGIADGLVLTTFLAFVNGFAALLKEDVIPVGTVLFAVCGSLLVTMLWVKCLRFMSTHGIERPKSRLLLQAALYPLSVFVVGDIALAVLMLMSSLAQLAEQSSAAMEDAYVISFAAASATVLSLSIAAIFLLRYLFRRFIVLGAAPPEPAADAN